MTKARIGVIGGSGLYQMEGLTDIQEMKVSTPFGEPSDAITVGTLSGERVAFLPRHGRGHRLLPSELPVQANIYALKSLGVEWIISVSAVGSMKEEIAPLDIVIPDQLFDRTRIRPSTFFGRGIVAHVAFAEPFCNVLSGLLYRASDVLEFNSGTSARAHRGGTYLCMEGPQFSTKGESLIYRQWGVDVIGMTAIPEAKLAREAEICYAILACVTDYDCWHEAHEAVTVEMVVANLHKNVDTAKRIIAAVVPHIPRERTCACARALENAIMTRPELIPAETKAELSLFIGKYLK